MEAMVAVGAMATSSELRRPVLGDAGAQRVPTLGLGAGTDQWSGCSTPSAARVSAYAGCAPRRRPGRRTSRAPSGRSPPGSGRQRQGLSRVEGQPQREEHVLQAHHARGRRDATSGWRPRPRARVEVEVDDPVEQADGGPHGLAQLLAVDVGLAPSRQVLRQVDRPEVADRRLLVAGDLEDLGAQVRQVDDVAGCAVWLQVRFAASLNVIQPLPVCASVRIMRPYSSRALT